MPRAKPAPKRKCLDEAVACTHDALLIAEVEETVEKLEIDRWQKTIETTQETTFPAAQPCGLARIEINADDLNVLRDLHRIICGRIRATGWGGVRDTSGRQRGYGYFSGCALSEKHFATGQSMLGYTGDWLMRDRDANMRASVLLTPGDLPPSLDATLERLMLALREALPRRYARVLKREFLVAAQPNLHNGKAFLKPHLDEPLNDGFGGSGMSPLLSCPSR